MNLKTVIKPQLWSAISNTYESGNYNHAILDAMHYLSEVLREKSGLDGDGHRLVGAALGGESPVLRVNKLQTETEKNIQKGLEQILRGMYQGIRNPRSHEQIEDTKETADAIIHFLNHLLVILDESQEPFTIPGYLDRVFDKHFVRSARYAELLVSEVPNGKRLDALIEIYRRKREGDGANLAYVVDEMIGQLTEEQLAQFLSVISEDLKVTQANIDVKLTIQILPTKLWPQLNEASRLRVENILIRSIHDAEADHNGEPINNEGKLGTWASSIFPYFILKSQASDAILHKLEESQFSQNYVFKFFSRAIPTIFESSYDKDICIEAIVVAIQNDSSNTLISELSQHYWSFPDDWKHSLEKRLPDLAEEDIPF